MAGAQSEMAASNDKDLQVTLSPGHHVTVSLLHAWLALVAVCWRRQARMRQMVWIALGLLVAAVGIVALISNISGWSSAGQRFWLRPMGQAPSSLRAGPQPTPGTWVRS